MDKMASVGCPVIVVGGRRARDSRTSRSLIYPGRADMLCPSVISRFGTLADKQRFDAASAMGQNRSLRDPLHDRFSTKNRHSSARVERPFVPQGNSCTATN